MPRDKLDLTDDEGTFLSLLARIGPSTAYQVSKVYSDSPVSNFGTSKGKIYPMIKRMRDQGLIRSTRIEGDARGSEALQCTAAGIEAVRHWVRGVRPGHLLLEDPLRTKVQSFDLLTRNEQLEWIASVRESLAAKLDELEAYGNQVDVPYKALVHDNAVSSLKSRLEWLERVRDAVDSSGAGTPAPGRRR